MSEERPRARRGQGGSREGRRRNSGGNDDTAETTSSVRAPESDVAVAEKEGPRIDLNSLYKMTNPNLVQAAADAPGR